MPVPETETLADTHSRAERGVERGGERDRQTGRQAGTDRKTNIQKTGRQRSETDRPTGMHTARRRQRGR